MCIYMCMCMYTQTCMCECTQAHNKTHRMTHNGEKVRIEKYVHKKCLLLHKRKMTTHAHNAHNHADMFECRFECQFFVCPALFLAPQDTHICTRTRTRTRTRTTHTHTNIQKHTHYLYRAPHTLRALLVRKRALHAPLLTRSPAGCGAATNAHVAQDCRRQRKTNIGRGHTSNAVASLSPPTLPLKHAASRSPAHLARAPFLSLLHLFLSLSLFSLALLPCLPPPSPSPTPSPRFVSLSFFLSRFLSYSLSFSRARALPLSLSSSLSLPLSFSHTRI